MHNKLQVAFDDPQHGWVGLTISDGDKTVKVIASYTPYDSFLDLTNALYRLHQYEGQVTMTWNEEPWETDLCFSRMEKLVRLQIIENPDHRRGLIDGETVLDVSGTYEKICIPFWRALRDLQGRFTAAELDARWHRPFPSKEINMLTETIRNGRWE